MLPESYEDLLHLPSQFTQLDNGESFLVSSELLSENGVAMVFISPFEKRILANSTTWAMDGTFETVPDMFSQIYVVFGSGGDPGEKVYPAAFLLLPDKLSKTYRCWLMSPTTSQQP